MKILKSSVKKKKKTMLVKRQWNNTPILRNKMSENIVFINLDLTLDLKVENPSTKQTNILIVFLDML